MKTRIITGIGLAIGFVAILLFGQYFEIITIVASIIGVVAAWEIFEVTKNVEGYGYSKLMKFVYYTIALLYPWLAVVPQLLIIVFGLHLVYIISFIVNKENYLPMFAFSMPLLILVGLATLGLTHFYHQNMYYMIFFVLLSSGTDVCAYFVGYLIGKNKLIPWVSPNKTIEGAIGGILGAFAFTMLGQLLFTSLGLGDVPTLIDFTQNVPLYIGIVIVLSILSQFGDLFFSKIKRYFDKKDFGYIFPGHGGVLDRADGLIFVIITMLMISISLM